MLCLKFSGVQIWNVKNSENNKRQQEIHRYCKYSEIPLKNETKQTYYYPLTLKYVIWNN